MCIRDSTTGSGKYFRNVALDPAHNIGIVEIDSAGGAWRIVWGPVSYTHLSNEFKFPASRYRLAPNSLIITGISLFHDFYE